MTVEMMSDEEKVGDTWVRHRPSYRSDLFNHFLDKLDSRASDKNRARFPRDVGSPREKDVPSSARKWMLCSNMSTEQDEPESPSLFSSTSNESDEN